MIVPGRAILFIAAMLALALVAAVVVPALALVALAGDLLLIAAVVIAGLRLRAAPVRVEREAWSRLEIEQPTELIYRVENLGRQPVIVTVRERWPEHFSPEDEAVELRVEPGEAVRAALSVTAHKRGRFILGPAQVDVRDAADLARWRTSLDGGATLAVYPNLRAVAAYDRLRRHRALGRLGVHRIRIVGSGREFDQLREYLPDDQYTDINWKATARRRAPISNVFQAERSQDVLLCLDCGRMMGNPVGEGTALDRAVDAAVMLAYVSQRSGDRVGLVLFRDVVDTFIKPGSDNATISRIIARLVDAGAEGVFPSYSELAAQIRRNQNRRSMVFLFTDLNDPQLATNLTQVLRTVSSRHVVVVISLRDPLLAQIAEGPADSDRDLYRALAARALADERAARMRELIDAGCQVLEVDADSIGLEVINAYLAVKMRQLV